MNTLMKYAKFIDWKIADNIKRQNGPISGKTVKNASIKLNYLLKNKSYIYAYLATILTY